VRRSPGFGGGIPGQSDSTATLSARAGPRIYLALLALLSIVACFLPLVDHLGYELSELLALAAGTAGAAPGIAAARIESEWSARTPGRRTPRQWPPRALCGSAGPTRFCARARAQGSRWSRVRRGRGGVERSPLFSSAARRCGRRSRPGDSTGKPATRSSTPS